MQLTDESERGFFLPSANKFNVTGVKEIPRKLLPRNFFDLPLAIQAEDVSGNLSIPIIFEISSGEELEKSAMIPAAI